MPPGALTNRFKCDLTPEFWRVKSRIDALSTTTSFDYGPDGERFSKTGNGATTCYISGDGELKVDAVNPAGRYTSYITADVRKESALDGSNATYDFLIKDEQGSVRVSSQNTISDYGPFGAPKAPPPPSTARPTSANATMLKPGCNICTPGTTTPPSEGSCRPTPGSRRCRGWILTGMPTRGMIR
jgi:hypothetical protein